MLCECICIVSSCCVFQRSSSAQSSPTSCWSSGLQLLHFPRIYEAYRALLLSDKLSLFSLRPSAALAANVLLYKK